MGRTFFHTLSIVFSAAVLVSCSGGAETEKSDDFVVTADEVQVKKSIEITGSLTDKEDIFSKEEEARLLEQFSDFEKRNAIPVAVLTTQDLGGYNTFTDFADAASTKWNGCLKNEGIMFVLSNQLAEIRMISCPGTETRMKDEDFDHVINTILFDAFKKYQYSDGIISALEYLDEKLKK